MQPAEFGAFIGAFVVRVAEQEFTAIHRLLGRDPKATSVELPLAMAWVTLIKLEQLLDERAAVEAIRMMLAPVMRHIMGLTGWDDPEARNVMENRLNEYDVASADEGLKLLNITNYFAACCESLRGSVKYDEIIPDPDELRKGGDMVNPEAIVRLNQLRRDKGCPTFPLDVIKKGEIGTRILSIGAGVASGVVEHF